jgi:hypothetical protein
MAAKVGLCKRAESGFKAGEMEFIAGAASSTGSDSRKNLDIRKELNTHQSWNS